MESMVAKRIQFAFLFLFATNDKKFFTIRFIIVNFFSDL